MDLDYRSWSSKLISPDGKRLASNSRSDGTVKVWDAQTGQELLTLTCELSGRSLTFSPDGKRLASGGIAWNAQKGRNGVVGGQVTVWDAQTGQVVLTFPAVDV